MIDNPLWLQGYAYAKLEQAVAAAENGETDKVGDLIRSQKVAMDRANELDTADIVEQKSRDDVIRGVVERLVPQLAELFESICRMDVYVDNEVSEEVH